MNAQISTLHAIRWETWALNAEANRRFRRIFAAVAIPALILAIIVPLFHLSPLEKGGGKLRNSSTTIHLMPTPPAPKAAKPEQPKPQPEPQPKPQPKPKPKPKPETKPITKPKATKPAPVAKPRPKPKPSARERAQRLAAASGLNQLSALSDTDLSAAAKAPVVSGQLTTQGSRSSSDAARKAFEQSATQGSQPSHGASAASQVTRPQSGHGVGTRRTATVTSSIGSGRDMSKAGANGNAVKVGRTLREIQLVFDRNKSSFYALYNRALRRNPSESGKIVVSLTIASDGHVSECHVVYSNMGDAKLEKQVLTRVKMLNFGAKDVPSFTYPNYPIHFVPPS
ncbi:MAG: AgmX/PglI C-terminal domain-containing protein [Sinobacteraceae bacterium]|nr:AgmX/PglI C-terminal domain-containing protein [Nevskiaceae bacterium]